MKNITLIFFTLLLPACAQPAQKPDFEKIKRAEDACAPGSVARYYSRGKYIEFYCYPGK